MLFILQPVGQKYHACKDNTEHQGITELRHRLCNRRIRSEDCESYRKKDDQAADIVKNCIAQEQKCFCTVHFCNIYRNKAVFDENSFYLRLHLVNSWQREQRRPNAICWTRLEQRHTCRVPLDLDGSHFSVPVGLKSTEDDLLP